MRIALRTVLPVLFVFAVGCLAPAQQAPPRRMEPNELKLGDVLEDILKGQQKKSGGGKSAGTGGGKAAKCTSKDGAVTCACYTKCVRTATDCHCEDDAPAPPTTTLPPSEPGK